MGPHMSAHCDAELKKVKTKNVKVRQTSTSTSDISSDSEKSQSNIYVHSAFQKEDPSPQYQLKRPCRKAKKQSSPVSRRWLYRGEYNGEVLNHIWNGLFQEDYDPSKHDFAGYDFNQFAVSKERLRKWPRSWYKHFFEHLTKYESYQHLPAGGKHALKKRANWDARFVDLFATRKLGNIDYSRDVNLKILKRKESIYGSSDKKIYGGYVKPAGESILSGITSYFDGGEAKTPEEKNKMIFRSKTLKASIADFVKNAKNVNIDGVKNLNKAGKISNPKLSLLPMSPLSGRVDLSYCNVSNGPNKEKVHAWHKSVSFIFEHLWQVVFGEEGKWREDKHKSTKTFPIPPGYFDKRYSMLVDKKRGIMKKHAKDMLNIDESVPVNYRQKFRLFDKNLPLHLRLQAAAEDSFWVRLERYMLSMDELCQILGKCELWKMEGMELKKKIAVPFVENVCEMGVEAGCKDNFKAVRFSDT